jgi:hypothetical protein
MPDQGGRIASHCKYVLEVSIVYLGVYRAIWMAVVQSSAAEPYNVTSGLDNVLRKNGNSAFRGPSAQRGGPRDANLANSLPSGNPRLRLCERLERIYGPICAFEQLNISLQSLSLADTLGYVVYHA